MDIKENAKVGLANYETTAIGGTLGILNYAGTVGLDIPRTREQWLSFAISALLAVWGLLQKDAATGTKPGEIPVTTTTTTTSAPTSAQPAQPTQK